MSFRSSWRTVNDLHKCYTAANTYIVEALRDLGTGLSLQEAYQNQEHGLIQESTHGDALRCVSISLPIPQPINIHQ